MLIRFEDCVIEEWDARACEDLWRLEALRQADARLPRAVISALVYKTRELRPGTHGIEFPLESVFGRKTLQPNSTVAFGDEVVDGDSPLEFQWFLDGRESTASALWGDAASLRASHLRPKWDLSQA